MKIVRENLNEVQNFERGLNPKKSMDIGINSLVKDVDSDDLFLIWNVMDSQTGELEDFENFIELPYYSGLSED